MAALFAFVLGDDSLCLLAEEGAQDHVADEGDHGGGGDGEDPGDHDALGHAPVDRRDPLGEPHAQDGGGDDVGRARGEPEGGGAEDDRRRGANRGLRARARLGPDVRDNASAVKTSSSSLPSRRRSQSK